MLHLDFLRLIASAGIVFIHCVGKVDGGPQWRGVIDAVLPFDFLVDLFFTISGFVIAFVYFDRVSNWRDYGAFLQRRVARLGPLHWLTLAILVVVGLAVNLNFLSANHPELYDFRCLPANVFFLHATGLCPHLSFNGPSWSISAEICMYVLSPLFFMLARKSLLLLAVVIVGLWTLLTLNSSAAEPWMLWTAPGGVLRAFPSYLLGILFFMLRAQLARIPYAQFSVWIFLALFLAGCILGFSPFLDLFILYATVALAIGSDMNGGSSAVLRAGAAGGQLTYSSYMLHDLVFVAVITLGAEHIFHLHGAAKNVAIAAGFVLVWPASYVSLMVFEHPARKWMSGLGRRSEGPIPAVTRRS